MLKQFTVRGLPKHRHYNLNCSNPLSDSYLVGRHSRTSSDSLRQFFGYESEKSDLEFDQMDDIQKS